MDRETEGQGDSKNSGINSILVLLMLAVKLVHLGDEDNSTVEHNSDMHATA